MKQYAALMDWGQILRCPLFLKWSMDSMQIISKIQVGGFVLVNRLILNCIWQGKGSKISKSFQKEHSCIIYADTVIMQCSMSEGSDI